MSRGKRKENLRKLLVFKRFFLQGVTMGTNSVVPTETKKGLLTAARRMAKTSPLMLFIGSVAILFTIILIVTLVSKSRKNKQNPVDEEEKQREQQREEQQREQQREEQQKEDQHSLFG